MWYSELFQTVESEQDELQAQTMAVYMKGKFPFLGIPKPKLKQLIKPWIAKAGKEPEIDWEFVTVCWEKDYREAQYIGVEYLKKMHRKLKEEDILRFKELVTTKSWWDVTDNLDELVGELALKYPYVKQEMLIWSVSENLWLRRVAIDFQQKWKEETDQKLLESIICNNLGSREFFINKGIGWSLREYSKCNPAWVKAFVERHGEQMAPLSKKEATRLL